MTSLDRLSIPPLGPRRARLRAALAASSSELSGRASGEAWLVVCSVLAFAAFLSAFALNEPSWRLRLSEPPAPGPQGEVLLHVEAAAGVEGLSLLPPSPGASFRRSEGGGTATLVGPGPWTLHFEAPLEAEPTELSLQVHREGDQIRWRGLGSSRSGLER